MAVLCLVSFIIEAARQVLRDNRVPFHIRADQAPPWHPGRCAALFVEAEERTGVAGRVRG